MKNLFRTNLPILILGLVIFSCSPAKKVADQNNDINVLKEQFTKERKEAESRAVFDWIKDHQSDCPEYNLDSLCQIYYDLSVLGNNTSDTVHKTDTVRQKPRYILQPYEDKRKITLYLDSINSKQKQIEMLQQRLTDKDAASKDKIVEIKSEQKSDERFWKILFFSLLVAEFARIILKYKFKISWL